jgi:penicillin-binding protein 1B
MSSKATNIRVLLLLFVLGIVLILFWASKSVIELKKSTKSGWFDPPTEIFTAPITLRVNQKMDPARLSELFKSMDFKERGVSESLGNKEYTFMSYSTCEERYGLILERDTRSCFLSVSNTQEQHLIEISYSKILKIHRIEDDKSFSVTKVELEPILLTKLSNKKPIKRTYKKLSHIPRYCIDAVLAIEDDRFLNHRGVSVRGILRAALTNLKSGRISQGGSTLTQQLVKNKFLSSERTLTRKLKEAWLSLLLELVLTKDEILESYLNYIYWGQLGPYAIHGIEEASLHYYGKSAEKLNLSECSLLAGAVKGPGIYGPHKEKSKPRQEKVLERMVELALISKEQERAALLDTVRLSMNRSFSPPKAPYYVDALFKELSDMGYEDLNGLRIYTHMDIFVQNTLEESMDLFLKSNSKDFYGSLIVGDPLKHSVIALTSGTSLSQNFNSAIDAKRQIGSLAKPFVYLTAFQVNPAYTPLTEISNDPFVYEYEGQKWSPKNYSKDSTPFYPLFMALAKSKNRPTVRLMSEFGYKKVYETLMNYGFSEFSPVTPSLALGSFEASPLEVLGAYMALSRLNPNSSKNKPEFLKVLRSDNNEVLFSSVSLEPESVVPREEERMIIEILKNTLKLGTARRTNSLNLRGTYAGKTGTTNDHKDGWFAALSPNYTFVTWLGESEYTKRKKIKLTGASGALPIWMNLIKRMEDEGLYSTEDWPQLDLEKLSLPMPEGQATLLLKSTSE